MSIQISEEHYKQAVDTVRQTGSGSVSNLQRHLNWGYVRAAACVERMQDEFIVSPMSASGRRDVYPEETHELWKELQAARAQAVPAKLVLELEKGRFKEYEFKALLRQSLRASKVTRSKLNWVHVMGMLGTGSTVAHRICQALGVNPDGTEFKAQEPAND